tara:strand:- start:64 stop:564 length:501 start_codon:yes stop_codon:yes gene_type:complete
MATTTELKTFGILPNEANKRKIASQKGFPTGIGYPLAVTLNKKVTAPITSPLKVNYFAAATGRHLISGMLRQLFLTRPGQRVMLPDYGLKLDRYVFEPLDITVFELLKRDILTCIENHVPFLEVLKLKIFPASNVGRSDSTLVIYLTVRVRDNQFISPFEVGVNLG